MTASAPSEISHPTTAGSLSELLARKPGWQAIAAHLDALPADERVRQVLAVTSRGVKALYEAVAGSPVLTFDDFVPAGESGTVIFEGRNSLPLFTRFQKRFTRSQGQVIGYNHQTWGWVTGPGYFVVKPPEGEGPHPDELFFDYTAEPPLPGPEGWPTYAPNGKGLSRAVYANMKDYCRRVAKGILVGKAYKLGVDQGAYFSLSHA